MRKLALVTLLFCVLIHKVQSQQQTANGPGAADSLTWQIPGDGGTPRDAARITTTAFHEYHIQASFEEGGESVLKHAVSRMDVLCTNNTAKSVLITLRIDLSQDGKRTDYDNKPEAGMRLRDFLFIKPPQQSWQQINGETNGWQVIVKLKILPGITQVGLSPWYTYTDYLSFIGSLAEGPNLKKTMIGKSDGNREHWELTITDTSVAENKKEKIFWQAREHAYETFSSFAMEGLIPFLLSQKAASFRKHFILIVHPMSNIDGVAKGHEYRAGYDFPEARGSNTGKLTFARMDSLRPEYAVAWHNWVAPRDRNVVFYTDGENGKATTRAWLRFTQLFPSLRKWGHRWKDEGTPEKYNWQDRAPGGNNIHSYGHRTYGTNIWGWEMPWWNFTIDEARIAGADFGLAFLTTLEEIKSNTVPAAEKRKPIITSRYKMNEWNIKARANVTNAYQQAMLVGEFTSPAGKKLIIDGFYDGNDNWKIRFTPDEAGEWTYLLRGEGVPVLQQGTLVCNGAADHGIIGIHPENKLAFAYADSTPFFPMGDTNYGLYDDSPITPALRNVYLKKRSKQGFNFIRMETGHSLKHAKADNAYWAWGGTVAHPDFDQFNPAFFHQLDSLLLQMRREKLNAELILLNYYRWPFTDTSIWTLQRERSWIHYLLARYAAFDNIFMWTISNEYETHPDGQYKLDTVADINWVRQTARYIRENDPYKHLLTVHPVISSSTRSDIPGTAYELPWRIGGFYGSDTSLTVLSQQTGQTGKGIKWDEKCKCFRGDDPELTNSIYADRVYNKPVINTENGYEYLPGQPTMRNQVHHTDKVRHSSWRIVCAGGYFAAGFSGTIGHNDIWNEIDSPNKYRFIVTDKGAGAQLSYLYNFFTALPFWKMQPYKNVQGAAIALASPEEKIAVLYFPNGGKAVLDWQLKEKMYAHWFNPRTGKYLSSRALLPINSPEFIAPDKQDWVLLLSPSVVH